jgi:hypothetical protein
VRQGNNATADPQQQARRQGASQIPTSKPATASSVPHAPCGIQRSDKPGRRRARPAPIRTGVAATGATSAKASRACARTPEGTIPTAAVSWAARRLERAAPGYCAGKGAAPGANPRHAPGAYLSERNIRACFRFAGTGRRVPPRAVADLPVPMLMFLVGALVPQPPIGGVIRRLGLPRHRGAAGITTIPRYPATPHPAAPPPTHNPAGHTNRPSAPARAPRPRP